MQQVDGRRPDEPPRLLQAADSLNDVQRHQQLLPVAPIYPYFLDRP